MNFEDYLNKIEGITNDFEAGISDKAETNTAIMQLVMDVAQFYENKIAAQSQLNYEEAKTIANWDYSLWTKCPECLETVDLLDNPDFWHNRELDVLGTAVMQDVECPKCKKVFKCNIRND